MNLEKEKSFSRLKFDKIIEHLSKRWTGMNPEKDGLRQILRKMD